MSSSLSRRYLPLPAALRRDLATSARSRIAGAVNQRRMTALVAALSEGRRLRRPRFPVEARIPANRLDRDA